ncbi:MAG: molybdopterin-guanine dinucleotide biosynthesis protein B [Armatimonadota bacterium]|nr:molybdopterin-guanine dinucleotide biosynthesis protein B [Armatimonadota bacterium]
MRADPVRPAASTTTVEEAQAIILRSVSRGPVEEVALAEAAGRILAEPVVAAGDLWPFPRAAMDGIAVRAADVAAASAEAPVALRVVGAVPSGRVWPVALQPGTAVRIATGAPVPSGADAVIPRELLVEAGDRVLVSAPVASGRHIFPAGEDARAGEVVLEAGTVLGGGQLGLLASLGVGVVRVVRRATVAILATGDELIPPTRAPRPGQVRESNSYHLAGEVAGVGATPRLLGIARDDAADLVQQIREGLQADVLIVCGGASVGDRDLVRDALVRAGVALQFVGVAMKPGAPVAFGLAGGRPVFALPGTPGAARMAFELLVRPALCAIMGHRRLHRPAVRARLARALALAAGRRRFLWARATLDASGVWVAPLAGQGTATLRSASEANALIEVQPQNADLPAGAPVTVRLLVADSLPTLPRSGRPALAVVGARDAGKTTLIERLIPELHRLGITVAAVKHHAHLDPDNADTEGTDTARFARAGAATVVLAGPAGVVRRRGGGEEPPPEEVLAMAGPADLVLVEGYSQSALLKILVQRRGVPADRPAPAGPVVAVVCDPQDDDGQDAPTAEAGRDVPVRFDWNAVGALAEFIARQLACGWLAPP